MRCRLDVAAGKILRQDVVADQDSPPFDRVMMDGLAVRSSDLINGCRRFVVGGAVPAGSAPNDLPSAVGSALEVMTGAVLPAGADCVLPCEWYDLRDGQAHLHRGGDSPAGSFIHRRASDHTAGDTLMCRGVRIGPVETGIAAACGCAELQVTNSFRIAVLGTGDELVPIESIPGQGQIRRTNIAALAASLTLAGHAPGKTGCLRDDPDSLRDALSLALSRNEIVVVTGGVSKGRWDFVPETLEGLGARCVLHGIAQKPGKPMGVWQSQEGAVVFGLPGNPVSALVCLRRYVLPALERWSGTSHLAPPVRILRGSFAKPAGLTFFLPVVDAFDGTVAPAPVANSGDFSGLAGSAGFVEVNESFVNGEAVPYFPWST